MKHLQTRIAVAVGLLSVGSFALAATETTTFGVSATVADSCNVTATALGFGSYDPIGATDLDATTTIDVTCSNGTAYDVGLNAGTTTGATVTTRQMQHSTSGTLNYSLFSDSARSANWGDAGGTDVVADTGTGAAKTHTVYGRIPSGQSTSPTGSYSDTITVTVTY